MYKRVKAGIAMCMCAAIGALGLNADQLIMPEQIITIVKYTSVILAISGIHTAIYEIRS